MPVSEMNNDKLSLIKFKHVTRIDQEEKGTHGWYVRLQVKNTKFVKFFSDSTWGGIYSTLMKAVSWRNEKYKEAKSIYVPLKRTRKKKKKSDSGVYIFQDKQQFDETVNSVKFENLFLKNSDGYVIKKIAAPEGGWTYDALISKSEKFDWDIFGNVKLCIGSNVIGSNEIHFVGTVPHIIVNDQFTL